MKTQVVIFCFGGYQLDVERMELRGGSESIAIEPQVFALLVYLVRHRDRVVAKEELLDKIWGDRFVSESALTSRIKSARQAIGDDGTAQSRIRTVHGTGYRFVAETTELNGESSLPGQPEAPTGPLTFLFTDVEQSSSAWNKDATSMAAAMIDHDELLGTGITEAGGTIFKHTGDGVCAVFASPMRAIDAAVSVQAAIAEHEWPGDSPPRVRMGLHLGEAIARDGDYFGPVVNKTARITDAAHGGQIVGSAPVVEIGGESLPADVVVRDEGWFPLDDFGETNLFQIHRAGGDDPRPLRARRHAGRLVHEPRKSLIGRFAESAHLAALLAESPLVTIVGPAGVGKTHLALHVATQVRTGAFLVELAKIREPAAVGLALLTAIGAVEQPGTDAVESACRALEDRDVLLVIDNCEHLHDAAAALCSAVLDRCRKVTLLATSRQRLGIAGERVVTLDPLTREAAIEVFVDRARELGVEVDPTNPRLAGVCERLDGIPLAIELASGHIRVLGLDDLERLLDDRLQLLEGPAGSAVDHHRTLEGAISWSYTRLEPADQRALDCLTVFAGSFDLAAAEAVIAEPEESRATVVRRVLDLCERSLVVAPGSNSGPGRYRLLESIRLFGDAQLPDRDDVRRRHVAHFVALTERASALTDAAVLDEQVLALEVDWDNVRAAFEYAELAGDVESTLRIINAVATHAELTQTFEVAEWCERALAAGAEGLPSGLVRDGMANFARLLAHRNDLDRAAELAGEAERLGPSPAVSLARFWKGWTSGDFRAAAEALDVLEAQVGGSGNLYEVAQIVLRYFLQAVADIDAEGRIRRLDEIADAGSDIVDAMLALSHGLDGWKFRDPTVTLEHLERAQGLAERLGLHVIVGGASTVRSMTLAFDDDLSRTTRAVRDGLRHYLDSGMWTTTMAILPVAARMLNRAGDEASAALLLGVRVASHYQGGVSGALIAEEKTVARAALGDEFDAIYARGTTLGAADAARIAIDALDAVLEEDR